MLRLFAVVAPLVSLCGRLTSKVHGRSQTARNARREHSRVVPHGFSFSKLSDSSSLSLVDEVFGDDPAAEELSAIDDAVRNARDSLQWIAGENLLKAVGVEDMFAKVSPKFGHWKLREDGLKITAHGKGAGKSGASFFSVTRNGIGLMIKKEKDIRVLYGLSLEAQRSYVLKTKIEHIFNFVSVNDLSREEKQPKPETGLYGGSRFMKHHDELSAANSTPSSAESSSIECIAPPRESVSVGSLLSAHLGMITLRGGTYLISVLSGSVPDAWTFDLKGTWVTLAGSLWYLSRRRSPDKIYNCHPKQGDQERFVNWRSSLSIGADEKLREVFDRVREIFIRDVAFLEEHGRIDYSVLVKVVSGDAAACHGRDDFADASYLLTKGVCIDRRTRVYLAIIDYLGTYDSKKKAENWIKERSVSDKQIYRGQRTVIDPMSYAKRFRTGISTLLGATCSRVRTEREYMVRACEIGRSPNAQLEQIYMEQLHAFLERVRLPWATWANQAVEKADADARYERYLEEFLRERFLVVQDKLITNVAAGKMFLQDYVEKENHTRAERTRVLRSKRGALFHVLTRILDFQVRIKREMIPAPLFIEYTTAYSDYKDHLRKHNDPDEPWQLDDVRMLPDPHHLKFVLGACLAYQDVEFETKSPKSS